jgi:acyl-CoA synthetase (AMP-forming)/AMP-acid ligase II
MPKVLEILEDLPRTPNMKVSRQALRERERQLTGVDGPGAAG